jgi:putative flavoprotein involved in K+ transport
MTTRRPVEQEPPEQFDVIVIGGGQAGLATGYFLAQEHLRFVILDANERVGDSWRRRWDSLRVFTPARYDGLPGMPFPADRHSFPTKDQVADYLEAYAGAFNLPVRGGVRVDGLWPAGAEQSGYLLSAGDRLFLAGQVVVATGGFFNPGVPAFAGELDSGVRQLHSSEYRNPSQLQEGGVLVVGAGNSGAEIALDVAREHRTLLSGRDTGHLPFDADGPVGRLLDPLIWFVANHLSTVKTPLGRSMRRHVRTHGVPVERATPQVLEAAGVERIYARTVGVRDGKPLLDDGRVVDVANVIWCTGFDSEWSWIHLPILGDDGWPRQDRGVAATSPGLYFVGLMFMRAIASHLIGGVGRDAAFVAERIADQAATTRVLAPAPPGILDGPPKANSIH